MSLSPVYDVCWIAHTVGQQVQADLATLFEFAASTPRQFCLALMGKAPATPPKTPENVHLLHAGEPRLRWDLEQPAPAVNEELTLGLLRILREWRQPLSSQEEAELLRKMAHLLLQGGSNLRVNAIWRQPEIIRSFIELHERRQIQGSCVDSILVANDLLEMLSQTVLMVDDLPQARVYHSLRSTFCGFVGVLAAERHEANLLHSASLDSRKDTAPFWLQTLPHHWYGSLLDSRVYRLAGARAMKLANELIEQKVTRLLTPFPADVAALGAKSCLIPPGLALEKTPVAARASTRQGCLIGWLVDVMSLERLEFLGQIVTSIAQLGHPVSFRVLEASPERRRWIVDYEDWVRSQPFPARLMEGARPFRVQDLAEVDVLVADGTSENALWSTLQALGQGTPSILANEPARLMLAESAYGQHLPVTETPLEIASLLARLVSQEAEREALGHLAKETAARDFSQSRAAAAYREVYQPLLS